MSEKRWQIIKKPDDGLYFLEYGKGLFIALTIPTHTRPIDNDLGVIAFSESGSLLGDWQLNRLDSGQFKLTVNGACTTQITVPQHVGQSLLKDLEVSNGV